MADGLRRGTARLAAMARRELERLTFPRLLQISAAVLGLVLLVLFFWPVLTTFVVVAESEVARAVTIDGSSVTWRIPGATVCAGEPAPRRPDRSAVQPSTCEGAPEVLEDFDGYLDLHGPLEVRVERLSMGPLEIGIRPAGDAFRVRARHDGESGQVLWLEAPVNVRLVDPSLPAARGLPVSLPLVARSLSLGRETALEGLGGQPVLRTGTVTLLGRSLLGHRPYAARKVALEQGDTVTAGNPESSFRCLLRVDERPAVQSLFRVRSYELTVRGFFSEPRKESLSFLDKVLNDRLFAATSSVFALLVAGLASLWNAQKES